jgi:CheY-like chemotaxis protein
MSEIKEARVSYQSLCITMTVPLPMRDPTADIFVPHSSTFFQDLAQVAHLALTGYWHGEYWPDQAWSDQNWPDQDEPTAPPAMWCLAMVRGKVFLSAHQPLSGQMSGQMSGQISGQILLNTVKRYSPSLCNRSDQAILAQIAHPTPDLGLESTLKELCELTALNPTDIARAIRLSVLNDLDRYWAGSLQQARFVGDEQLETQLSALQNLPELTFAELTFAELLNESQVRQAAWRPLRRWLPDMTGTPVLQTEAIAHSSLTAVQKQRLHHLVQMGSTLAHIAEAVAEDLLKIAQVFAKLIEEGFVVMAAGKAIAPEIPEIVVIDDSALVLQQFDSLIRRWGYRVKLINNPLKAVESMLRSLPAIVFLDLNMPEMNGFDLVKAIRQQPQLKQLPLVILTADRTLNNNWHARLSGCQFLSKPTTAEEVPLFQRKLKTLIEDKLTSLNPTAPNPTSPKKGTIVDA